MTVLYIILLAIVQGITEFLPVSSFGHLCILCRIFLDMDHGRGCPAGGHAACGNSGGSFYDISEGYPAYCVTKHSGYVHGSDRKCYICIYTTEGQESSFITHRIISNTYRKFASSASCFYDPDGISGLHGKKAGCRWPRTPSLIPSAGLLITGILLAGY